MSRARMEEPHIATEKDVKANWLGGQDGLFFRCSLCGHKFQIGDYYRCVYTNDMQDAYGNPIVCKSCDEGNEKVRDKWKERHAEFMSEKFWWFRRS